MPFCQQRWFKIQNYYPPARHSLKSERPAAAANLKCLPHITWLKLFIVTKERRLLYFFCRTVSEWEIWASMQNQWMQTLTDTLSDPAANKTSPFCYVATKTWHCDRPHDFTSSFGIFFQQWVNSQVVAFIEKGHSSDTLLYVFLVTSHIWFKDSSSVFFIHATESLSGRSVKVPSCFTDHSS